MAEQETERYCDPRNEVSLWLMILQVVPDGPGRPRTDVPGQPASLGVVRFGIVLQHRYAERCAIAPDKSIMAWYSIASSW